MRPAMICVRTFRLLGWQRKPPTLTGIDSCIKRQQSTTSNTHFPVTIVGGGPTGLFLSNLLSQYRISHMLLEAKSVSDCFVHPQAHFINTRSMEIIRTCLPFVYERVMKAMQPVHEYQNFVFGHDLIDPQPLAVVTHPLQNPLQVEQDANGKLKELIQTDNDDENLAHSRALSPCRVGHLAQHRFARILHETALESANAADPGTMLQFGARVKTVHKDPNDSSGRRLQVFTEDGRSWTTDVCVAADGASSALRQAEREGKYEEQHLMNIHVHLTKEQNALIPHDFMLYTVLNELVVSMVVSHGQGEYVLQIPFFPPYQDPREDFSPNRLSVLLEGVFGFPIAKEQIKSARPWTMTSWIASRYHNREGVVWVGDAAHAFPPAGGFGMNTGLQDVHNLAWKLSSLFAYDRQGVKDEDFVEKRELFFDSYEQERQPVAAENAALSVRNYNRVLSVMNECYLNSKHPEILKQGLDGMSLVPLSARQDIFRSLMKTALQPLAWLRSSTRRQPSMYRQHIESNLRKRLTQGGGLPLLFPRFELGFGYGKDCTATTVPAETSTGFSVSDTWASSDLLKIQVGRRFPHARIAASCPNSRSKNRADWSTIDLPTLQVTKDIQSDTQIGEPSPSWTVVVFSSEMENQMFWEKVREDVQEKAQFATNVVHLLFTPSSLEQTAHSLSSHFVFGISPDATENLKKRGAALIRPDGHVAVWLESCDHSKTTREAFLQATLA